MSSLSVNLGDGGAIGSKVGGSLVNGSPGGGKGFVSVLKGASGSKSGPGSSARGVLNLDLVLLLEALPSFYEKFQLFFQKFPYSQLYKFFNPQY